MEEGGKGGGVEGGEDCRSRGGGGGRWKRRVGLSKRGACRSKVEDTHKSWQIETKAFLSSAKSSQCSFAITVVVRSVALWAPWGVEVSYSAPF